MKWEQLLNRQRPRESTLGEDHRVDFERDFDRAVFSTPVKRLQDKAQVFPLDPCDAVRTRLTHSLEVSSVAKGLGVKVADWLVKRGAIDPSMKMDRAIEAITATCGLIHDLGNPPFGHSGEDAIREWFRMTFEEKKFRKMLRSDSQLIDDFLLFEGNAQSLRLVGKLQVLSDYHGLNLTFGTLSASCKYTAASHEAATNSPNHAKSKPGYFASENELIKQIREATGTGEARNPLTFLVEAADDIVYCVADIEDGVKKGLLTWSDVSEDLAENGGDSVDAVMKRIYRILQVNSSTDLVQFSDDVLATALRTAVIGVVVYEVCEVFQSNYHALMDGTYQSELVKDCAAAKLVKSLKVLARKRVFCAPSILKLELMGKRVLHDLMDLFWEGAQIVPLSSSESIDSRAFSGKAAALLSDNYRKVFQHFASTDKKLPEVYHRLQMVTDYVCGMTDSFAKRLHSELMNGV